ncbi:MAG: hypothetical protein ACR2JB_18480 [Bryobacteraceae bacterium]
MADGPLSIALKTALARPDWKPGGQLTASGLNLKQSYQSELLHHHLGFLHGWGVLCGLTVVSVGDPRRPWLIRVCPGYGIGPCGGEMPLGKGLDYDLQPIEWRLKSNLGSRIVYVGLRLGEVGIKPIVGPAHGCGCGCGCAGDEYKNSRLRDKLEVSISTENRIQTTPPVDLCKGDTAPCPPCPPKCDLMLASIILPGSSAEMIDDARIDNSIRPIL